MNGQMTVTLHARVRRLWLLRLAVRLGSLRFIRWAASRVRIETRIGHGCWTYAGRLSVEVEP